MTTSLPVTSFLIVSNSGLKAAHCAAFRYATRFLKLSMKVIISVPSPIASSAMFFVEKIKASQG